MGYTVMGAHAGDVQVQVGTVEETAEALGIEFDEENAAEVQVVLNNLGDQTAFIVEGEPVDFLDLASRLYTAAARLFPTADPDTLKVIEEAIGDAYAYRVGEATGLDDPDLDEADREPMLRYQQLAERLGVQIT
jgi:hypothetical protein